MTGSGVRSGAVSEPPLEVPSAPALGDVRVVEFEPRWRSDFARLNIEWIERWFSVEPADRELLDDPEGHVLASGGQVLFAIDESERAVGTVALVRLEDGRVELTKMAVEPEVRGLGVGRLLMAAALESFQQMRSPTLFLETNTKLAAAIKLYESVGFRHQPTLRPDSHHDRADVYMVWAPATSGHA